MFDVTALGELLIDFTPCGLSTAGQNLFEQNPGGAPANVLAAVSRLGGSTAFMGKVGEDMHGRLLQKTLAEYGINTENLILDPDYFTTLAFVSLENGERSFSFARKPGADTQLRKEEIRDDILRDSFIFHFGSLSLTDEPARSATLYAADQAKAGGAVISYDPNYRAPLWKNEDIAIKQMRSVIPLVDIMKISDEETTLLTDHADPEEAAHCLLGQGVGCVVVTLGSEGALLCTKDFSVRKPSAAASVVDTTGAGDSFWGGLLYCLSRDRIRPETLTEEQASSYLIYANTVAGLCVGKRGAIPAMPSGEEVEQCLQQNSSARG